MTPTPLEPAAINFMISFFILCLGISLLTEYFIGIKKLLKELLTRITHSRTQKTEKSEYDKGNIPLGGEKKLVDKKTSHPPSSPLSPHYTKKSIK